MVKQLLTMIGGRAGFADTEHADARIAREAVPPP